MNTYKVNADSVNIHSGILGLDADQAQSRRHRLTPRGIDRFEVMDPPVCFKRGEVFAFDGDLPKDLVEVVEQTDLVRPAHATLGHFDTVGPIKPRRAKS